MFEGVINSTILGNVEFEFLRRCRHALRFVPEGYLERVVSGNIERFGGYHGSVRVVLKAQGAVTRMDVVPVVADSLGISTSVKPAIEGAVTGAVLFFEAIETNSLPYRFSVGS